MENIVKKLKKKQKNSVRGIFGITSIVLLLNAIIQSYYSMVSIEFWTSIMICFTITIISIVGILKVSNIYERGIKKMKMLIDMSKLKVEGWNELPLDVKEGIISSAMVVFDEEDIERILRKKSEEET